MRPRTQLRMEGAYRHAWQAQVLTLITTRLPDDEDALNLVAAMRWRSARRFVAHLQRDVLPHMKQLTRSFVEMSGESPDEHSHGSSPMITPRKRSPTGTAISIGRQADRRDGGPADLHWAATCSTSSPQGWAARLLGLQATCILARMRQKVVAAVQGQCSRSWQDWAHHVQQRRYREQIEPRCSVIPLT